MKTLAMPHQTEGLRRLTERPKYYGLFCEQGTGKTWMLLADAEQQWENKQITGLLVIAPKGVHSNWVRLQIPEHLSCDHFAVAYKSGAGAKHKQLVEQCMAPRPGQLVVLAMNIDAVGTKDGFAAAKRFLTSHKAMMVVDESHRIKNSAAMCTRRVRLLGELAVSRRIATGTPVTNAPWDAFSQFEFLAPGQGLLGHTSERAFRAAHAELLPSHHPLIQSLPPRARQHAQIVARNPDGTRRWRNLGGLAGRVAAHSYRVTKAECLSLPEKVYSTLTFELSAAQRRIYEVMDKQLRLELDNELTMDEFTALTKVMKLQQITSGFVLHPATGAMTLSGECQGRLSLLMSIVEDSPGSIIIWAAFREEIDRIGSALEAAGETFVRYQGGMSQDEMAHAVDAFQNGAARVFVGNAKAGGTGITLTAAETVIYYSNTYALGERLQSEDRAHRIGTKHSVRYIDLAAEDTIDEKIAAALQSKGDLLAALIRPRQPAPLAARPVE